MSEFQKRLLPRLVLDTINCLQTVYGELDTDLRTETRENLASLLQMDVTDIESAIDVLLTVAQQLREVESAVRRCGTPIRDAQGQERASTCRTCDADLRVVSDAIRSPHQAAFRDRFPPVRRC